MCIVTHGWAHGALWCAKGRRRVLCSSQHVFFMSQGEGREPGFRFQVSRVHPLCPPKIGVTSPQGGGGMTNGNVKTENGKLIAHPLAAHLYRPLRPSGTSPNLEEESGCEPTFMFQSFKFHVSIHFVPLSQGDEEQSSGGGMFLRSSLPALFYIPPSASPYPTSH